MGLLAKVLMIVLPLAALVYLGIRIVTELRTRARRLFVSRDRELERWGQIARRLRLAAVGEFPREHLHLAGEVAGERVSLRRESGSPLGGATHVYEVRVDELVPEEFAMTPRDGPEFVDPLVGRDDIAVGEERLDEAFVFQGAVESDVEEFVWTEGVADHLTALCEFPAGIHIRDGVLRYKEVGELPPADQVVELVRDLAEWVAELREIVEEAEEVEVRERSDREWVAPE